MRLGLVFFAAAIYTFGDVGVPHDPVLTWVVIGLTGAYSLAIVVWRLYEDLPWLVSAWAISVGDGLAITAFLIATGGWASPWYPFWYVSILVLALRFGGVPTLGAATAYTGLYAGIAVWDGALPAQATLFAVRAGLIYVIAALGMLLADALLEETVERQRFEDLARKESYQASLLQSTLDVSPDGVVVIDHEGRITTWNDPFQEMWDVPEAVLERGDARVSLERVVNQVAHPKAFRQLVDHLERNPEATHSGYLEFEDGRVYRVHSRPQRLEGAVVGRVWTFRDVTETEQLLQELREASERLELAQEVANVGHWEWDVTTDTIRWSDQTYRLLGRDPSDPEEPTFDDWLEGVHPDDREKAREKVQQAMETGRFPSFEHRVLRPDGSVRWVESRGDVETDDGEVTRMHGTILDITERKGLIEGLREAKEEAEAADRAKTRFLANTSHELRTPLNAVIGLSTLLLDRDLDEREREMVETIRGSGEHLLGLVENLLDLSHLEELGGVSMDERPFEPRAVVDEAVNLVAPQAEDKSLALAASVGAGVPEVVRADPDRFRQVLVNLLTNAVKFTEEGGVDVRVSRTGDGPEDDDAVLLQAEVEDTGPGVPRDAQETLFDPFVQVDDSTTREEGGTGLGLAISRNLVELMGGTIDVRSTPGEGSTFRFTFRAEPTDEEPDQAWRGPEPVLDSGRGLEEVDGLEDAGVLLVEDNAVNRRVASQMLHSLGVEVDQARDGEEALESVREGDYDLVLMDVQMPRMDGLETTERIRDTVPDPQQPRVVALTAHAGEEDRRRCMKAGMDGYLPKPVEPDDLASVLEESLSGG